MRYVRQGQDGVKYVYADSLPNHRRRFVVHPLAAIEAATGLPVEAHLHEKILKQITPGDLILGAIWDPIYEPPPMDVPQPSAWDAPPADRAAFLSAVVALREAVNRNVAKHFVAHARAGEMDDNIVQAVEWLVTLAERAEDLADGA
jgi:hypothetical protein